MSKTVELARHLETLHINNMYKNDFYWTWDKTDEEIDAVFTVADALRDLRERNKNTKVFNSGLGISIVRDNSTRTGLPLTDKWTFSTNGVTIQGRYGIPCVGFGPGAESQAHAPNEITWKQDLVTCAALYAAVPGLYHPENKDGSATSFRQELTGNDIK